MCRVELMVEMVGRCGRGRLGLSMLFGGLNLRRELARLIRGSV